MLHTSARCAAHLQEVADYWTSVLDINRYQRERFTKTAIRKLNGTLRGKKVATALADLEFSRKRISLDVRKCLQSAIANAENNHDLDVDDLVVAQAFVGKALVMKRFHARARGRGARILKPFANITIVVREVQAAKA